MYYCLIYIIISLSIIIYIVCNWKTDYTKDYYQRKDIDKKHANSAIKELHKKIENNEDIPTLSDEEFRELGHDQILIIRVPLESEKEKFSFYHPANQRYWPNYYYSFPYTYANGGTNPWPEGLYSRLYNYTPAFNTSGWSFDLRPNLYYKKALQGRWIRHGMKYYYINNENPMKKNII